MPNFPWGAALATGAGVFGSLSGGDDVSRRTVRRRGRSTLERWTEPRLNELFGGAEQQLLAGGEEVRKGWDAALRETTGLQRSGARRILEREQGARQAIEQDVTSRGLSHTAARQYAQRGLQADTQRALSDHDARFADMRSRLHTGRGAALYKTSSDLASHYRLRYGMESRDILDRMFQLMTMSGGGSAPLDLGGLGAFLDEKLMPYFNPSGANTGSVDSRLDI